MMMADMDLCPTQQVTQQPLQDASVDASQTNDADMIVEASVDSGPQPCAQPNGNYQFVWTVVSGDCGAYANEETTLTSLLGAIEFATLGPSGTPFAQNNVSIAADNCSASLSATGMKGNILTKDVVSIQSNQNGSMLTGNVSVSEQNTEKNLTVCSGMYTFLVEE